MTTPKSKNPKFNDMSKIFKVISVSGRQHVITNVATRDATLADANYLGTGMALCGVLNEGETLVDWRNRTRQ